MNWRRYGQIAAWLSLALAASSLVGCGWPRDPDEVAAIFDDALRADGSGRGASADGSGDAGSHGRVKGPLQCDDKNPCTFDSETEAGCNHAPLDDEPCDDDMPCLWLAVCKSGVCAGAPRLWSTQYVMGGKRNDAMDVAELDKGELLVVGQAPSTTILGSHLRPFRMVLRGDGIDVSGEPWPHPVWLDPSPQEELITDANVVRLIGQPDAKDGPTWMVVGTATDKPLGDVPQPSRAYWRRFKVSGTVFQHSEVKMPGSTSFADAARLASGAVVTVGTQDQSKTDAPDVAALVCRIHADGTLNSCETLKPIQPSQHSRLRAVVAIPGEKEHALAVGDHAKTQTFAWTEDSKPRTRQAFGDAAGGLVASIEGPKLAIAWQKTYAPSGGWKAGELEGAVVLDEATAVLWGQLGAPDPQSHQGWRAPYGGDGELWLLKVKTAGGEVLAEQRIKLPGSPRALVGRGDRLWLHQLAPGPADKAALWSFDHDLAPRGLTLLPMMTSQRLVPLSNGDWLIAGTRQPNNENANTHLMRVDGLGGSSCSDDAACAPGKVVACDDGLPCTLDSCLAGKGCSVAPQADGIGCGVGKCAAGLCQ